MLLKAPSTKTRTYLWKKNSFGLFYVKITLTIIIVQFELKVNKIPKKLMDVTYISLLLSGIEIYLELFFGHEKRPKAMELRFWRKVLIFVDDDFKYFKTFETFDVKLVGLF